MGSNPTEPVSLQEEKKLGPAGVNTAPLLSMVQGDVTQPEHFLEEYA